MTTTPFAQAEQPAQPIPRDRWMRPIVTPPEGGKGVGYTRCTTFVKCLDDTTNLTKWLQRMAAVGIVRRPDLQMAIAAADPETDKTQLDKIIEEAREAAGASAKATLGTAIHALTERIDRGEEIRDIPLAYVPDLAAYREATKDLEVLAIEEFVVQDSLKVGGTLDRRVRHQGRDVVADIKTGNIDYAALTISMQLATYANSVRYDHTTNTREPLGVDLDRALIIHLPAGTGTCRLVWVDIKRGWEAVQVAAAVREARAMKHLTWPLEEPAPDHTIEEEHAVTVEAALLNAIAVAATVDDLTALWNENQTTWGAQHTEAAVTRKQQLAA